MPCPPSRRRKRGPLDRPPCDTLHLKGAPAITQAQRRIALIGHDIIEEQFARWPGKAKTEGLTAQEMLVVNAASNMPVDKLQMGKELAHRHPPSIHADQAVFIIKKGE